MAGSSQRERRPSRSKTRQIIRMSSGTQPSIRSSPPVTPASAMNEAISMWSGETECSHPPSAPMPWTYMTFEPMPSIAAPILLSMRARSCTCGSLAALRITVVPGVSAAAISAFSVPITDGSSMKKSVARSPPLGARSLIWRSCSTSAPSARKASRCVSSRRRPITSPPGGGIRAEPKRASSGPAVRNDARIRSAIAWSTSVVGMLRAHSATVCSERHSTVVPSAASRSTMASASRIRGTLCRTTSSSVRRAQAMSGSAAFLLPAGTRVPDSGTPPWMTNFSIGERGVPAASAAEGRARVTAMATPLSRDEAWSLFCEWTGSESLRRHVLCVEAAMRAYAEKFGEDPEEWGTVGILHDLDYEKHPDAATGHPRVAMEWLAGMNAPESWVRAIASHADYMDTPRETPMEKTLYAVDELSGFIVACAKVRPEGVRGLTPKSVKKKLKQPSFAAAVNREEVRRGAQELGVDFDEPLRTVIGALGAQAAALGLEGGAEGGSAPA